MKNGRPYCFSAIILAGGKSERIGSDKAFLRMGRSTFLSIIAEEMLLVSSDVITVVGRKKLEPFAKEVRDSRVRFAKDSHYIGNPLGGMLTGLELATNEYAAVVACDLPLVRNNVISRLFEEAKGHDAAVPIWDTKDKLSIEPLCAVYNVQRMKRAINDSLGKGISGCKLVVRSLPDVRYVPVSELKEYDRDLDFLNNINTTKDYLELLKKRTLPILSHRAIQRN